MAKKKDNTNLDAVNKNSNLKPDYGSKFIAAVKDPIDHKAKLREAKAAEKAAHYQRLSQLSDQEWEKVRQKAHDILHGGRQGYESPLSALLDILVAAEQRNKALFAHNDVLHFFYRTAPEWVGSLLLGSDTLPGVKHDVEFDDDNTLCIQQLFRNNSSNPRAALRNMVRGNTETEFTQEQMLGFQGLVVAWLREWHNCEPNANKPGAFTNKNNGFEVTKADFDRIMKDSLSNSKDLNSYLEEKLGNVPVENLRQTR